MTTSILPASLRNLHVSRLVSIMRRGLPRWRTRTRRCRMFPYVAEGGPLHGKTLMLTDGSTAVLRIGQQRGRYLCGLVADKWDNTGTTVWKPA